MSSSASIFVEGTGVKRVSTRHGVSSRKLTCIQGVSSRKVIDLAADHLSLFVRSYCHGLVGGAAGRDRALVICRQRGTVRNLKRGERERRVARSQRASLTAHQYFAYLRDHLLLGKSADVPDNYKTTLRTVQIRS